MAAPARFLFDNDFAAPVAKGVVPTVPMIELADHEVLLAEAIERARAEGYAAGQQSAEVLAAERVGREAGRLAMAAQLILDGMDFDRARLERDAIRLADVIGRRLAGRLVEQFPHERVMQVVIDAVEPLRNAPHLVVRLEPEDAEALRAQLVEAAAQRGFAGRLVVMGEPGIGHGDCRIQWADGGVILDRAAVEAAVDRAITTHLDIASAAAERDPGESS